MFHRLTSHTYHCTQSIRMCCVFPSTNSVRSLWIHDVWLFPWGDRFFNPPPTSPLNLSRYWCELPDIWMPLWYLLLACTTCRINNTPLKKSYSGISVYFFCFCLINLRYQGVYKNYWLLFYCIVSVFDWRILASQRSLYDSNSHSYFRNHFHSCLCLRSLRSDWPPHQTVVVELVLVYTSGSDTDNPWFSTTQ